MGVMRLSACLPVPRFAMQGLRPVGRAVFHARLPLRPDRSPGVVWVAAMAVAGICMLLAVVICGRAWAQAAPAAPAPSEPVAASTGGEWSFRRCTATLSDDPDGARDYAEDWQSHGGGLEAEQCDAMAQMELGDVATAATMLDHLAHVTDWSSPRQAGTQAPADTALALSRRAGLAEQAARAWQADDSPRQALDSAAYGLTLRPDDAALKLVYARVAVELGQPARAVETLTPLPGSQMERDEALVARAAAWRQMGRIDKGMADINAALKDMPDNGAALLERGILYQRQGLMEAARADWQDVVAVAPDSDEADLARQDLSLLETDPEAP